MLPKTTLTIASVIGLIFSFAMFLAPEFVTREQFPNSEGQGFADLVTLRYAIASIILALVIISYHLRDITNLALQLTGKISALPPILGTGIIAVLSLLTWRRLVSRTKEEA